jgi:toxin-antitoxin system PIN domain toxin
VLRYTDLRAWDAAGRVLAAGMVVHLLHAYDTSSSHHETCRAWLESAFNTDETIALPWQTILAFVRISTSPRAVKHPLSSANACTIVGTWLERANVVVVNAADRFWNILRQQILDAQVSGPLVTDAALVALAIEQGAILCSTYRDFRRFQGLKLVDPIQPVS